MKPIRMAEILCGVAVVCLTSMVMAGHRSGKGFVAGEEIRPVTAQVRIERETLASLHETQEKETEERDHEIILSVTEVPEKSADEETILKPSETDPQTAEPVNDGEYREETEVPEEGMPTPEASPPAVTELPEVTETPGTADEGLTESEEEENGAENGTAPEDSTEDGMHTPPPPDMGDEAEAGSPNVSFENLKGNMTVNDTEWSFTVYAEDFWGNPIAAGNIFIRNSSGAEVILMESEDGRAVYQTMLAEGKNYLTIHVSDTKGNSFMARYAVYCVLQ